MSMFAQLIVACFAAAAPAPSIDSKTAPADAASVASQLAGESFSKLRKIHLVRPDLIGYPLVIDVIC